MLSTLFAIAQWALPLRAGRFYYVTPFVTWASRDLFSRFRVDGVVALQILSDAAKSDLKILRTLMNLARGVPPKPPAQAASDDSLQTNHLNIKHTMSKVSKLVCRFFCLLAQTGRASAAEDLQNDTGSTQSSKSSSDPTSSKFGLRSVQNAVQQQHHRIILVSLNLKICKLRHCSDIYEKTEYDSSHSKSNARSGRTRSIRNRDEDLDVDEEEEDAEAEVGEISPV